MSKELSSAYSPLRMRINVLGTTALVAYGCMALLSYAQAPALWQSEIADAPRATVFFKLLGTYIDLVPIYSSLLKAVSELFASNADIIITYWIPLALATAMAIILVLWLSKRPETIDPGMPKLLFRWSSAFAVVSSLAFPLFTQDLWLSAVWGRMIVAGVNPYHHYFTLQALRGFPLDHFNMTMSYGPLWALISGGFMAVARNSVLVTAILFKGLLLAAWIGSLVLITRLMRDRSVLDRSIAIALVGWTPLGVTQFMAEGHNDIVMMSLVLLWWWLLVRSRRMAPIALMASVLCKYVAAPLFLIDAIYMLRVERIGWRGYLARLVMPAIFAVLIFALFYRSPAFFDGLKVISKWHFLQPRDAISAMGLLTGVSLASLSVAVSAVFPLLAVYYCIAYFRTPTSERLQKASISVLASVCFTAVSHLWPWYMIWVLPFAVQLPMWWLSRFVIAVTTVIPFAVVWWISPFANQMAAPIVYGAAVLATIVTRLGTLPCKRALDKAC